MIENSLQANDLIYRMSDVEDVMLCLETQSLPNALSACQRILDGTIQESERYDFKLTTLVPITPHQCKRVTQVVFHVHGS